MLKIESACSFVVFYGCIFSRQKRISGVIFVSAAICSSEGPMSRITESDLIQLREADYFWDGRHVVLYMLFCDVWFASGYFISS